LRLLCRRAEGLFKSFITIQYDYTMQSTNFSIPVSIQMCNFSMNAALFSLLRLPPCGVPRCMGQAVKKRNRFLSIALWWAGIVL
jgi:hypothetical protein